MLAVISQRLKELEAKVEDCQARLGAVSADQQLHGKSCAGQIQALQAGLASARAGLQGSLLEQERRLALADCRRLISLIEMRQLLDTVVSEQGQDKAQGGRQGVEKPREGVHTPLAPAGGQVPAMQAARLEALTRAQAQLGELIMRLQPRLAGPGTDAQPYPPAADAGTGILGHCDCPPADQVSLVQASLRVSGWALAPSGVEKVEIAVDGKGWRRVAYGSLRPDVAANHPDYADADHSGFLGSVPREDLEEGEHVLVARILARDGSRRELCRRFTVGSNAGWEGESADINREYQGWLRLQQPKEADWARARKECATLPQRPTISLVAAVCNTPQTLLEEMVDSVKAQVYPSWELCLADDGSSAAHVRPLLERLAAGDGRIKVAALKESKGITAAAKEALGLASGELVGLLGSEDVLDPFALYEVVRALQEAPEADLVYSDEDKMDEGGRRWDPFFKPDWSPDLLLSMNYIGHFVAYRRKLLEELGGWREEYGGSQDYDLVLRVTERTQRIRHVPKVLYSRRAVAGPGGQTPLAGPQALEAARRAVADALRRRGYAGRVDAGWAAGRWRARYELQGQPAVTLLIVTGGKLRFLKPCLKSVLTQSSYANFRVLVLDNSEGKSVARLCNKVRARYPQVDCRDYRLRPFNYAALNNYAMRLIETPYVVLLNDDITVVSKDWIEAMLEQAQRPEVGVVGAKLLYPDDTLQHAGVILAPRGSCGHAFKHLPEGRGGSCDLPRVIRNCSAVTFACAMLRRAVYEEVGGLDEVNLAVAFNDVDLCLRLGERGYRVVYTPHAVLYHHESVTKTTAGNPGEEEHLRRRWGHVIQHDPYYNPNLSRDVGHCGMKLRAAECAIQDRG